MYKNRIGYTCPPFAPEFFCKFWGFETKTEEEQKQLLKEYQDAEKYYPSVLLDDGNYTNFYWLTKVNVIAGEDTQAYRDVWGNSSAIKTIKKGQTFGPAEVYNQDNPNWIGFRKDGKSHYWVYIKPKTISAKAIYNKGVPNDKQASDQAANSKKSWIDKFGENIGDGLKWGAGAVAAYIIYDMITKKESKKTMAVSGLKKISTTQLLIGAGVGLWIANEMGLFEKKQTGTKQTVTPQYVTEQTEQKAQKMRDGATTTTAESEDVPIEGFYNEFNF